MTDLKHPVTGHEIDVTEESVEFWEAAGYRSSETKSTPKKAPAKKAASTRKTGK